MTKTFITASLCIAALALAGCGGGDDNADKTTTGADATATPTATPTSTPKPAPTPKPPKVNTGVKGIDVVKVGRARDEFLKLCKERKDSAKARKDPARLKRLGRDVTVMLRAFRANPDQKFRRFVKSAFPSPKLSMRQRLASFGYIARKACGGGKAPALGERITKALLAKPKKT